MESTKEPRDYTPEAIAKRRGRSPDWKPTFVLDIETDADPSAVDFLADSPPPAKPISVNAFKNLGRDGLNEAAREMGIAEPEAVKKMDTLAADLLALVEGGQAPPQSFAARQEEEVDAWRAKIVDDCRVHPCFAMINAITVLPVPSGNQTDEEAEEELGFCSAAGPDEVEILVQAMDALGDAGRVVTFSGHDFDLPLLRTRAVLQGIRLPKILSTMPGLYETDRHVDLRFVLGGYRFKTGTLRQWCWRFGVDPLPPVTSLDDLAEWVGTEAWDKLRAHCRADTVATRTLARYAERLIPVVKVSHKRHNREDGDTVNAEPPPF